MQSYDRSSSELEDEWNLLVEAFAMSTGRGWVRVPCPICRRDTGKEDHKNSLGLNTATRGYHCFRGGHKGRLPQRFMDKIEDLEYSPDPEPLPKEPVQIAVGFMPLYREPYLHDPGLDFGRRYLERRGLKPEVLEQAGVGACCFGWLRDRVIVPILNYRDARAPWRGWVSRDTTGKAERPYLYPRAMDRTALLYNEPALWCVTDKPALVVEGTLDALAFWPDSVAVLGKPLDSQIDLMVASCRPVCVVLDGDAWVEGHMLALTLRHLGQRAGAIRLPPGVDPDETNPQDLEEAAVESITCSSGCVKF